MAIYKNGEIYRGDTVMTKEKASNTDSALLSDAEINTYIEDYIVDATKLQVLLKVIKTINRVSIMTDYNKIDLVNQILKDQGV